MLFKTILFKLLPAYTEQETKHLKKLKKTNDCDLQVWYQHNLIIPFIAIFAVLAISLPLKPFEELVRLLSGGDITLLAIMSLLNVMPSIVNTVLRKRIKSRVRQDIVMKKFYRLSYLLALSLIAFYLQIVLTKNDVMLNSTIAFFSVVFAIYVVISSSEMHLLNAKTSFEPSGATEIKKATNMGKRFSKIEDTIDNEDTE